MRRFEQSTSEVIPGGVRISGTAHYALAEEATLTAIPSADCRTVSLSVVGVDVDMLAADARVFAAAILAAADEIDPPKAGGWMGA